MHYTALHCSDLLVIVRTSRPFPLLFLLSILFCSPTILLCLLNCRNIVSHHRTFFCLSLTNRIGRIHRRGALYRQVILHYRILIILPILPYPLPVLPIQPNRIISLLRHEMLLQRHQMARHNKKRLLPILTSTVMFLFPDLYCLHQRKLLHPYFRHFILFP